LFKLFNEYLIKDLQEIGKGESKPNCWYKVSKLENSSPIKLSNKEAGLSPQLELIIGNL